MNIVFYIFEYIKISIASIMMFRLYSCMGFSERFEIKAIKRISVFVMVILLLIARVMTDSSEILFFLMIILGALVGVIIFRINIIVLLSISGFYTLVIDTFNNLVESMVRWIGKNTFFTRMIDTYIEEQIYTIIIGGCVLGVIYYLIGRLLSRFSFKDNLNDFFTICALMGIIGFLYIRKLLYVNENMDFTLVWALFASLIICAYIIFYFIEESQRYKEEKASLLVRIEMTDKKYEELHRMYDKNAVCYHDLKSNIRQIDALIDVGDMVKAKEYISQIWKPLSLIKKETFCGVREVDLVLNAQKEKMDMKGITFEYDIDMIMATKINGITIARILTNLLDNAIEACDKLMDDDRKIILSLKAINNFLVLRIRNKIYEEIKELDGLPKTTKSDPSIHGLGLKSVRMIADEYGADFDWSVDKNIFTAQVIMCEIENH